MFGIDAGFTSRCGNEVVLAGGWLLFGERWNLWKCKFCYFDPTRLVEGYKDTQINSRLSNCQEELQVENIISHSKNINDKCLIASVELNSGDTNLVSLILDHIIQNTNAVSTKSVLVATGYDFRTYYNGLYVNMDYLLYKDNDEQIANEDFFAIVTNISMYGETGQKLEVNHQINYMYPQIIDYGQEMFLEQDL